MKRISIQGNHFRHLSGMITSKVLQAGHRLMPGSAEYDNDKAARTQRISGVGIGRSNSKNKTYSK